MTYGHTPRQKDALTETQRAEILSLWATRSYDTGQLAERVGASEAVVYAVIAGRPEAERIPQRAAFAGKPVSLHYDFSRNAK